jgi:hypothetical protein
MAVEDDPIHAEFAAVQVRWRQTIHAHRMAPPDAGFSARLKNLAAVAHDQAGACHAAAAAGYSWPPHATTIKQPYELRPGTGRRGPKELWRRFDVAVEELNLAAAGADLVEVANAYDSLAAAAGELAAVVEGEDRASGLLPPLDLRERRNA